MRSPLMNKGLHVLEKLGDRGAVTVVALLVVALPIYVARDFAKADWPNFALFVGLVIPAFVLIAVLVAMFFRRK